ncbi:hypothetical protein Areg01_11020 [Actinoplanes regularis]|nr:hypothetical protein Are01nite_81470 [Actinoplanes regularis]GLW28162.1 hypothetical protein Areg01_11020 [Actinoplanes regularis]
MRRRRPPPGASAGAGLAVPSGAETGASKVVTENSRQGYVAMLAIPIAPMDIGAILSAATFS